MWSNVAARAAEGTQVNKPRTVVKTRRQERIAVIEAQKMLFPNTLVGEPTSGRFQFARQLIGGKADRPCIPVRIVRLVKIGTSVLAE